MSNTRGILSSAPSRKSLDGNEVPAAVHEVSMSGGFAALLADLERRRLDAERHQATAPVAAVIGAVLEDLRAAIPAGAASAPPPAPRAPDAEPAHLLTPEQAATRLGVTRRWLYRNAKTLPFTRRLSRRALRFDAAGLGRWVASRR